MGSACSLPHLRPVVALAEPGAVDDVVEQVVGVAVLVANFEVHPGDLATFLPPRVIQAKLVEDFNLPSFAEAGLNVRRMMLAVHPHPHRFRMVDGAQAGVADLWELGHAPIIEQVFHRSTHPRCGRERDAGAGVGG